MRDFRDKVAVVTGAASGIGKALADRCLQEGMYVVMTDIEGTALSKTVEEFQKKGQDRLISFRADVSKREDVEALAEHAFDTFGTVHLLFNNAGVGAGGSPWEATYEDWEWVIGVNLWSVIYGVKAFLPRMLEQDCDCHITNTASVAGLVPGGEGSSCYSVTKHGVVALTENLYFHLLARGAKVKASVLCPGFISTNILDSERNRPVGLRNSAEVALTPEMEAMAQLFEEAIRNGMPPAELAEITFKGIADERLYIQTHSEYNEIIMDRATNITEGKNPIPMVFPDVQQT